MQNQMLSGGMSFQKPPLVRKCSKTRHSFETMRRSKRALCSQMHQKPPLIQEQHCSRWSVCPWPRQACHSFRSSTAPGCAATAINKRGAADRCTAAPWCHFLPGHSATFQKSRRRGPCAWSFPPDKHLGLPLRLAARCPRRLGGQSGTRTAI